MFRFLQGKLTAPPSGLIVVFACCVGQILFAEVFYGNAGSTIAAACIFTGFILHLKLDCYFREQK